MKGFPAHVVAEAASGAGAFAIGLVGCYFAARLNPAVVFDDLMVFLAKDGVIESFLTWTWLASLAVAVGGLSLMLKAALSIARPRNEAVKP